MIVAEPLPASREVRYVMIQEFIRLGQRVEAFTLEYREGDEWKPFASGTTIGYKRILEFDPVRTDGIRINITEARACPVISNVEVY